MKVDLLTFTALLRRRFLWALPLLVTTFATFPANLMASANGLADLLSFVELADRFTACG